jgi:hypothetical protein
VSIRFSCPPDSQNQEKIETRYHATAICMAILGYRSVYSVSPLVINGEDLLVDAQAYDALYECLSASVESACNERRVRFLPMSRPDSRDVNGHGDDIPVRWPGNSVIRAESAP